MNRETSGAARPMFRGRLPLASVGMSAVSSLVSPVSIRLAFLRNTGAIKHKLLQISAPLVCAGSNARGLVGEFEDGLCTGRPATPDIIDVLRAQPADVFAVGLRIPAQPFNGLW